MDIEKDIVEYARNYFELPSQIKESFLGGTTYIYPKKLKNIKSGDAKPTEYNLQALVSKIKNDIDRICWEIGDQNRIQVTNNEIVIVSEFFKEISEHFGFEKLKKSFNYIVDGELSVPVIHELLSLKYCGPDTLNIIGDVSKMVLLFSKGLSPKNVLNLNITIDSFVLMHNYNNVKSFSHDRNLVNSLKFLYEKGEIDYLDNLSEKDCVYINDDNQYDLVLCSPPGFGGKGQRLFQKYLVQALKSVSDKGVILFTVPILTITNKSFKSFVSKNNINIKGIFETEKTFQSLQKEVLKSNLAILYIEKGIKKINESIFLAKINNKTPEIVRTRILNNFLELKEQKTSPSLGCFVQLSDYYGCSLIEFNRTLTNKFKKTRTKKYNLNEMYSTIRRIENGQEYFDSVEKHIAFSNDTSDTARALHKRELESIFIPMHGTGDVVQDISLSKNSNSFYQIYLKDEFDPNYVCNYLNSKIGKEIRNANSLGVTVPFYNLESIGRIQLHLPDSITQLHISELQNKLESKKNYLNELIYDISSVKVFKDKKIIKEISKINFGDNSLEVWNNTLPFPISSALTWYIKTNKNDKKFNHLLRFFEAYAQFISVVLLSALASDREFYKENKQKWQNNYHPNWINKSNFGDWIDLYTKLRDFIKEQYEKKETKEFIVNLVGQGSSSFIEFVTNRQIIDVLRRTCVIRNEYRAHSGMMTVDFQAKHLNSLEKHLNKFRERVSYEFDDFKVIYPINSELKNDGLNYNDCKLLKGPITPFKEEEVVTATQIVSKQLYFQINQSQSAIELLPFLKFKEKEKVFYYYSRTDVGNIKYISHHYEDSGDTLEPKGENWDDDIAFLF